MNLFGSAHPAAKRLIDRPELIVAELIELFIGESSGQQGANIGQVVVSH
jgi:hypothetical protein